MVTGVIWVLDYFSSSAFAAFEVDVLQRGESRPWDALIPHWDAPSQYTFYGPWIESFQDSWWDPEFPQLSQMVRSLSGFLILCLNVCSPSQVLVDVYTEVLEAAHPLHRGPTDHKRISWSSSPENFNSSLAVSYRACVCVSVLRWRRPAGIWAVGHSAEGDGAAGDSPR